MTTHAHFRARARRKVDLVARVAPRGSEIALPAKLVDLGLEGACLELPVSLEAGDPLRVFIELPGLWDALALEAVVAWTLPLKDEERARAGVRFSAPGGRSLRLLAELIASH